MLVIFLWEICVGVNGKQNARNFFNLRGRKWKCAEVSWFTRNWHFPPWM